MTAKGIRLESFDGPVPSDGDSVHARNADESEQERLEAYEAGYRSGWEDCAAQSSEDLARVGAELERNIHDMGFTYHEARNQILSEIRTLLSELFTKLLPAVSRAALAQRIIDDIADRIDTSVELPVEIVVSGNAASAVVDMMPATSVPISVVPDHTLPDDQAFLRIGRTETSYDFQELTERVLAALSPEAGAETREVANE